MERRRKKNKTKKSKFKRKESRMKNIQIHGEYMMDEDDSHIAKNYSKSKDREEDFGLIPMALYFLLFLWEILTGMIVGTRHLNEYGE